MSNIYIQEPTTTGKVTLKTSLGDIDIELWSREAPKACRNFVQLCLEGYYNKTIFHRVVKGFIAQGGDPTGTGFGGESVYGEPFKDEIHSRLRFVRRGLVAMANSEKDSNGSQFFFTLGPCQELQNKHTIFGKVAGNTLYNILKFEELQVDQNERPLYPPKIISTEVVSNPFPDVTPRKLETKREVKKEERPKVKGTKDYKLLSFGDEAEEEEEEVAAITKEFRGKSKSSHDLLKNDPKLSSIPAVDLSLAAINNRKLKDDVEDHDDSDDNRNSSSDEEKIKKDKDKLYRIKDKFKKSDKQKVKITETNLDEDENEMTNEMSNPHSLQLSEIRMEIQSLRKELAKKKEKKELFEPKPGTSSDNPIVEEFKNEIAKYKTKVPLPKGKDRAAKTLELLEKFKSKIHQTKEIIKSEGEKAVSKKDEWLAHELNCEQEKDPVLAKDANLRKEEDWFDIYDPRNPINKRRRETGLEAASTSNKKWKS